MSLKTNIIVNNDPDISADAISTIVTLRENGISECTLIANNFEGKLYLSSLKANDEVVVRFTYSDDDLTGAEWDTITPVFKGNIIELNNSLVKEGETLSVIAMGKGYSTKLMRVASEYGLESPVLHLTPEKDAWTESLDINNDTINDWIGDEMSADTTFKMYGNASILDDTTGGTVDYNEFYLLLPSGYEVNSNNKPFLNFCMYLDNKFNGNVAITLYDTTLTRQAYKTIVVTPEGWQLNSIGVGEENASEWTVDANFDWTQIKKIHFTCYFVSGEHGGKSWIDVLHFDTKSMFLKTLREVLTDVDGGVIPRYLEKVLNTEVNSKYSLNTDYIYDDASKYAYLNFPYQSVFMGIQDLIRLGSSLHYTADTSANKTLWRGLHWIVKPDGKLVIAPVGNHDCYGKDENYYIGSSDIWSTRMINEPLVVREDMIVQAFKTEAPLANYVLVAGKFIRPLNEAWTEINDDWVVHCPNSYDWAKLSFVTDNKTAGSVGVKMNLSFLVGANTHGLFVHPIANGSLDLTKLVKRASPLKIRFKFKSGGNSVDHALVFMTDINHFTACRIPGLVQDKFVDIVIEVTNETIMFNDDRWEQVVWEVPNKVNPVNWSKVNYIGFYFKNSSQITYADSWVDDLLIEGTTIRGAYTSDCGELSIENCKKGCIEHYGCRFLTIKDSLACTDTLLPNEDSTPLAQLALYELLRNRVVRTTGQIQIPLDPTILPGQLTHIHAAYDVTTNTYKIDEDFRITSVLHNFTRRGAFTNLELTNDLKNSIPINTSDPYTVVMRAINPDYQTKTLASIKTGGDFVADQVPISRDYPK